jgi:hypothetical protein
MKKYLLLLILVTACCLQCDIESIGIPVLVAPADNATVMDNPPTFIWQRVAGADLYGLQVAPDDQFNVISVQTTCYMDTSYTPANPLVPGVYFWRVRAQEGG